VRKAIPKNENPQNEIAADDQKKNFAEIEKLGGKIDFDATVQRKPANYKPVIRADLSDTSVTDADLVFLKNLTHLQELILSNTKVTDAGLQYVKGLKQLRLLYLNKIQVTDAGLVNLRGLTKLQELELIQTPVTDAGLEHLKDLTQLKQLNLWDTRWPMPDYSTSRL
jgi:hypothetical protein